jgi:hypothetical protein
MKSKLRWDDSEGKTEETEVDEGGYLDENDKNEAGLSAIRSSC